MNITIRMATLTDVPAICALSQTLFVYEHQFTDEFEMGWSLGKAGKLFFTRRVKSPLSFILLAEDGQTPVGYALLKLSKYSWRTVNPIAEVDNLSVDPRYRGKGVGTKLVEVAKAEAKKRGAKRMAVQALWKNERALTFYRTQGFSDFTHAFLLHLD